MFLFGTVKLVTNPIKSNFVYRGQELSFDGEAFWSFGNDFTRNIVSFGVDNSSSS